MDDSNIDLHGSSYDRELHGDSEGRIQFSSSAEQQLLQSISNYAPLPKILNEICIALDCQISNVVSLISLPENEPGELATIAQSATRFGLYTLCSEEVVAENNEPLGSLEIYCSIRRNPSAGERQLIERAKCLAAIAIKRHKDAGQRDNCGRSGERPVSGRLLEWPVARN